jgi:peptidoglycan/xylan/chitin deacetylase (PgdA/CDA1 family)
MTDASSTVCLTVDFDAVSIWMNWAGDGARVLSRGEFGAKVGAPRLLEIFDRYEIKTTWFVPGHTADTYPEPTAAVVEQGHELGNHGYVHESFQTLGEEEARAVLRKGNEALERVVGRRPVGVRVPAGDFSGDLLELFVEEGFTYDSSLIGEFEPWWARARDTIRRDGPNEPGRELDLVELPLSFVMNDFNYFEFNYADPALVGLSAPDHVLKIWSAQFDFMFDRVPGGVLNVTMHPQCIGWGLRARMLEQFIEHCLSRGARFATCEGVAAEFRARRGAPAAVASR